MFLSPHFQLGEMASTSHVDLAAANLADAHAYIPALTALCAVILEPVRAQFGPVSVHVAYRNAALNAAVGGAATSQHLIGEAADFHCPQAPLLDVYKWIIASPIPFGQAIQERRGPGEWQWIHLSLGEPWRPRSASRQALWSADGVTYHPWQG